ncbi:hypothetical protein [Actinophytocola xanthii]|uniref:Uncharacterized protein n=1 Tax=Actinophytocola xanthii TaxID=1912961 RepID=A0A1Q8BUK7_9PSEU|nr:hypothetical protein [Actinophytocola xanthii]OLF05795.1 hypothetical protein BU204_36835 [Actinophytocola xanthii]
MARTAVLAAALAAVLFLVGCSSLVAGQPAPVSGGSPDADRDLVEAYYTELNAAADEGTASQGRFLRVTQHPDYRDRLCELGGLTLHVRPAMSTFRSDPEWVPPEDTRRPRGSVYVLGVSISIRQQGALLGEQIGSQRVVVLDGRAYGFSPCPAGG